MKTKILLFLFISCFSYQHVNAGHFAGGDITWKCLPSGQYVFTTTIQTDCFGVIWPNPVILKVCNHPTVDSIILPRISVSVIGPQGCNSCLNYGPHDLEEAVYESAPITLGGVPPASGWEFEITSCCRSAQMINLVNPGSQGIMLKTIMYPYNMMNTNPAYDSSPQFSAEPQFSFCTGMPITYSVAAHDPDGDSLVYSFTNALDNSTCNSVFIPYTPGYTSGSPFPGPVHNPINVAATINPQTGLISLTSFTPGFFTAVIKVESYRCGELIAEVNKETLIVFAPCMALPGGAINNPPVFTPPFADGSGQFTLYSDTIMVGDTVQYDILITDADTIPGTMQNIYIKAFSNVLPATNCALPPCATFTIPLPTAPTLFSFQTTLDWISSCDHLKRKDSTCTDLTRQIDFEIKYNDDFCPVPGLSDKIVSVIVKDLQPAASPELDSMNIIPNGDVELFWNTPTDPNSVFTFYYIYYATDSLGPYTLIDSISYFNQTTYTHIGAMGNTLLGYYQMSSTSSILCQTNYEAPSSNRLSNNSTITGITNPDSYPDVYIYPNPGKNTLNIKSQLFLMQKSTIEIRNLLGQLIHTVNSDKNELLTVDMKNYESGVYIISIMNDNNKPLQRRFVKH